MDIDEFLESEAEVHKTGSRKDLVEKQSASFVSGRSIEGQIDKVRELIQHKQFKEAEKIYYVVKEQYATLAKRQQEERRKIHRELTQINKELIQHLNKVKGEMEQKGMVITDLLMKARQYMQQGNIDKANQLYLEVRRIFKQMPDAFSERKMMLENQILMFYSQLVNEFNRKKYDDLLRKRDDIMRHVEIARNYVAMGKVEDAKREYQAINKIYNEFPEGFLYEKTIIYKQILSVYQMIEEGNVRASPPAQPMPEMNPVQFPQIQQQAPSPTMNQAQMGPAPKAPSMDAMSMPQEETTPIPGAETGNKEASAANNEAQANAGAKPAQKEKKGFFSFMKKKSKESAPKTPTVKKEKKKEMDAPPLPM